MKLELILLVVALVCLFPVYMRIISKSITIGKYQGTFEVVKHESEKVSRILSMRKEKEKKEDGKK